MVTSARVFKAEAASGSSSESEEDSEEKADRVVIEDVPISENTYGMTICALVRDFYWMAKDEGPCGVRIMRLSVTMFLLGITLFIQLYLLVHVDTYICGREIHDIRALYGKYAKLVYGENITNPPARGIDGTFPGALEARNRLYAATLRPDPVYNITIDPGDIGELCEVPLSQPEFFGCILLVWTMTCLLEYRSGFVLFQQVVYATERCSSMVDAMKISDDDDGSMTIVKLPLYMKVLLTVLVFCPWICITIYLFCFGCRWLIATRGFEDLILNAVALGFIMDFKDTVYSSLMPVRNRVDLSKTMCMASPKEVVLKPTDCHKFSAIWVALALGLVAVFMYSPVQDVLPNYKWDVHEVCKWYIETKFAV